MPQHTDAERIALAEAWIARTPTPRPATSSPRSSLARAAGDAAASADLADRFDGRLAFGTAGLRGEIAAGPNRMNRVLVSQAAAGLAYLLERAQAGRAAPSGRRSATTGATTPKCSRGTRRDHGRAPACAPSCSPGCCRPRCSRSRSATSDERGRHGHGLAQPAERQRLQGLPRRRRRGSQIVAPADAEIAAHILRVAETAAVPSCRAAPSRPRRSRSSTRTSPRPPPSPTGARRAAARRLHGDARRRLGDHAPRARDRGLRRARRSSRRRSSPTRPSRRWRSRTPRNPARWTSRSRRRASPAPTS